MQHPISNQAFLDWLKTKPADGVYDYQSVRNCLICQYLNSIGLHAQVGPDHAYVWPIPIHDPDLWSKDNDAEYLKLPAGWNDVACAAPHTYGAALERASLLNAQAKLDELDLLAKISEMV